jgi:hypothetical protein
MYKKIFFSITLLTLTTPCFADDYIVYTAHQDWPSRLYILRMNGTVYDYFEYDFTRLCDVEVVNNEVFVAEAFAPRAYKVNLSTGSLDLIIDDWSLYYFYDLAFDGIYFYVDEWDLNRYFFNGSKDGVASFDQTVFGSAWNGSYLWTMDDNDNITCWDISAWPTITEVPANNFPAPDTSCRGLWFDGQYFWTAQSLDGALGYIYQFDYDGTIIAQWLEPAFSGWGACLVNFTGFEETTSISNIKTADLFSVSPNPFTYKITVQYIIDQPGDIDLTVCDILGQCIATLEHGSAQTGQHYAYWSGRDDNGRAVPPGIYFIRFKSDKMTRIEKILLVK